MRKVLRYIVLFLAVATGLPAFAGDVNVQNATELKNAIDSATTDKTIVLQNDINMSGTGGMNITGKSVAIDGQNHGITSSRNFSLIIKQKGNLTIKNVGQVDRDYNIISSFSNNYDTSSPWGGPITTQNNAGTVVYDENSKVILENSVFSNNYAKTDGGVLGLQTLSFDVLNSVFINNSAGQEGGAIWTQSNWGNIENSYFKGNFVRDLQQNTSIGGAITNYGYYANRPTYIDTISGTFIENYSYNFGGVIANRGYKSAADINKISGDFSANYAIQTGGAILNAAGSINTIDGTFIKNYLLNTRTSSSTVKNSTLLQNNSFGGAIANTATGGNEATNDSYIKSISGDFIGNFINTKNGKAYGGAIYNTGIIKDISGTFEDNYVFSEGTSANLALGGAIYSTKDLTITSGKHGTLFSGNYTLQNIGERNYNAIYIDNANATLNLTPKSGKTIRFDDNIDGVAGYNVNIESEYGGTLKLYNDIKNANITTNDVNIDFVDSKYHNYKFLSLNSSDTTNYLIDFKLDKTESNMQSDTITTTNASSGYVTLSDIHFIADKTDGGENYYNGTYEKQILYNGNLRLKLGTNLQQTQHKIISTAINDTINPITNASDKYYKNIYTGDLSSSIELATKDSTDDSIKLTINGLEWSDDVHKESLGDTFALWLDLETAVEKEFRLAANEQYKINKTLNTASKGKLSVIGQSNISSVIDVNNKALFDLSKKSDLTLKDVRIISAVSDRGSVVKAINQNSSVIIDNASFLNNIAAAFGGVLFNASTSNAKINGIFNANMAGSSGGAIYNQGNIDSIKGEFTSNHTTNSWATGKVVGGAIANKGGTINSITADFNSNYSDQYGGAIANFGENDVSPTINSISGNFNNNYIVVNNSEAFGGAIYNNKIISSITGDFISNHIAQDNLDKVAAKGGAIYNEGTNGLVISGNFLDNYISVNSSSSALGGAIYTKMNTSIVADNGQNALFKGNYVQIGNNKNDNAIYVDNAYATLTLNATNHGVISLYDNIDGAVLIKTDEAGNETGREYYNVLITGDNTGVVGLYNDIKNADVQAGKASISLVDGITKNYTFNSLNTEAETSNIAKWNIDVDLTNEKADTITTADDTSKGTVLLNNFNIIGSTEQDSLIIQILKNTTENDNLQLKIADGVLNVVTDVTNIGNEVFSSKSYLKQEDGISLATTTTTNDSIKFLKDGFYDALQLINQKETKEERKFKFDTAGTHTLLENLGETKSGTLSINGYSNDSSVSVIDLAGKTGFELANGNTTINLNNATLTDSASTNPVIKVTSENNIINLNNAQLKGNITSDTEYELNLSGNNVGINGTVDTANATLNNAQTTLTFNTDTFANASLSARQGTINLQDSAINNYNIGTLKSDINTLYNIDVDAFNKTSDTIKAGENSAGDIKIGSINFLNGITPQDKNFKVQILDTASTLTLSLSDAIINQLYDFGQVTDTVKDTITTIVNFDDRFYKSVKDFVIKGHLSVLDDKSIGFKDEDIQKVAIAVKEQELLDSLHELSNLNASGKEFNFKTADDVYGVMTDIGTVVNDLTINGVADSSNNKLSVIGLDNNSGFILNSGSTLNISNVNLRGTNSVITNNGGTVEFAKSNIINGLITGNGKGTVTNNGDLYISASNLGVAIENNHYLHLNDGVLNSEITGTVNEYTFIDGNVTNNAKIAQKVIVNEDASLTVRADIGDLGNSGSVTANVKNLTGDISNAQNGLLTLSGTLDSTKTRNVGNDGTILFSGTLDRTIEGGGVTKVNNTLILGKNAGIEGTLNLNNGTINTKDGTLNAYNNINQITGNGSAIIDIDWDNQTSDTFNCTNSGDGIISLIVDTTKVYETKEIKNITNGNVGIAIGNTTPDVKTKTTTGVTDLTASVNWADKFGAWSKTDTYTGTLTAYKSSDTLTVNNSIKYEVTKEEGAVIYNPDKDTLALITASQITGEPDKSFTTNDASAVFTVKEKLGTLKDNLTISGTTAGDNKSTINLNSKDGFALDDTSTALNLNNVKLEGNDTALITATTSKATIGIADSIIDGNIQGAGNRINFSGTSELNGNITNGSVENIGTLIANGTISGKVTNKTDSKLTANGAITGDVENSGTFYANSSVKGKVTNNTDSKLTADGAITGDVENSGTFYANSSIDGKVTNNTAGTLTANGAITGDVTNSGTLTAKGLIDGGVTNSGNLTVSSTGTISGNVTNNTAGKLTSAIGNLQGTLTNNGTYYMTGADVTLNKEISGSGTTILDRNATLGFGENAKITGTLDLNNGIINMQEKDGETVAYNEVSIGKLTGSGKATIDVDWANQEADTFTSTSGDGTLSLSLNQTSTANIYETKTIKITSGGVSISLAETTGTKTKTKIGSDNLVADVSWTDKFGGWTRTDTYNEKISAVSSLGTSVLDSIQYKVEITEGTKTYTPNLDTLSLIVQNSLTSSTSKKFTTDDATATYDVATDLGTLADNLTISGTIAGSNISTINLGNHQGITISGNNSLTLEDVKVTSKETVVNAESKNAQTTLNNAQIEGNIVNSGNLTLEGNTNTTNISGTGSTVVKTSAEIKISSLTQNTLSNSGNLTADKLAISTSATNSGTLTNNGTSSINALTNNAGAIINGNGSLTLSGTSSNKGSITQKNLIISGTATQGVSTYALRNRAVTGGSLTNTGTITAENIENNGDIDNTSGTLIGKLTNNGTITGGNITAKDGTINTGSITSANLSVEKGFDNKGNVSGTINISNSGNLVNNGSISGDVTNGGVFTSSLDKISGNIANNGTFKATGGTLNTLINGTGTTEITGNVNINGGSFGTTQSVSVLENSSLNIGSQIIEVNSFTLKGTLDIAVTNLVKNSSVYEGGQVLVNNADLSGGKLSFTIAQGLLNKGEKTGDLSVISLTNGATGSISGDVSSIFENNNRYEIQQGSSLGTIIIKNKASGAEVASQIGNQNNRNTADAWDKVVFASNTPASKVQEVLNTLSQHNKEGYRQALNQVAPSDSQFKLETTRMVQNIISKETTHRFEEEGCTCGEVFKRSSMWMQAIGGYNKQSDSFEHQGFKSHTTGYILGYDGSINCGTSLGFGYAYAKSKGKSHSKDMNISSHNVFVYGKYQPLFSYVRGALLYGLADNREKTAIGKYGVSSNYDTHYIGAETYVGYEYLNGITPEMGVRYTYLMPDDYTDSLGQKVKNKDISALTLATRLNYEKKFKLDNGIHVKPEIYAGVTYDLNDTGTTSNVTLGTETYSIRAYRVSRFGTEAGIKMSISKENTDVILGYDTSIKKGYIEHTGMLKLRYNF